MVRNYFEIFFYENFSVYQAVKNNLAASKFPKLADKLGKSIGFAMGIDFRESSLLVATKSTQSAKKGIIEF